MPTTSPNQEDAAHSVPADERTIISAGLTQHEAVVRQTVGFVGAGLQIFPDDALVILELEAQQLDVNPPTSAATSSNAAPSPPRNKRETSSDCQLTDPLPDAPTDPRSSPMVR